MKSAALAKRLMCVFASAAVIGLIAVHAGDGSAVYSLQLIDPVAPELPARVHHVAAFSDEHGFPAGYSLAFETHVCIDEQCRMVRITMYWNALGYYQGLEYPEEMPLTKKQHVPFEAEDYDKLDRILKDRDSILGGQPLDVLVKPLQEGPEIDGWSGATPQTVKDAVVEDAAFTTWSMWHWANGEIVPQLQGLTRQRATPSYLQHLLRSEDRREVGFALNHLLEHRSSDDQFVDAVFHVLETGDRDHASRSLEFLGTAMRDTRQLHDRLIASYCRMNANLSPLVIDYFAAQPDLPSDTLEGLTGVLDQLPYFPMHLILRLLDTKHFHSQKVEANIARLLDSDNFFIARRASEHLMKQPLGDATRRKLDTFRAQNRERL
jgi:hypothetical protein